MTTKLDNDTYQGDGKDALWWSKVIQLSETYKYIEDNGVQLRPTTIAVLDTSFDLEISELRDRYVDRRYHWDLGDKDNDVSNRDMWSYYAATACTALSPILHGTQVAALAAAENNGAMVNGIAYNARILPLKYLSGYILKQLLSGTLSQYLYGDNFAIAAGLAYVGEIKDELNIRAVNMSFAFKKGIFEGIPDVLHLRTLKSAVESLNSKGIILVAAAGNDNADSSNYYPCAYPEVICVGGTELSSGVEQRWSGSNFSDKTDALGIAAPANNILTTFRLPNAVLHPPCQDILVQLIKGSDYIEGVLPGSGTSFASPIVASTAALLKSIDPTLTPAETLQILRDTADNIETDKGTWKRVNVYKAVKKAACLVDEQCEQNNRQTGCSKIVEMEKDFEVKGFYGDYVIVGSNKHYAQGDYYLVNIKDKTMEKVEWPQEFQFPYPFPVKGIWKDHLLVEARTPSSSVGENSMILYNFKIKTFTVIGEGMNMEAGHGALVYASIKVNEWGFKVYDVDSGEDKLVMDLPPSYTQLGSKQAVSLRGLARTAFIEVYGPMFLLVNDLNNPNGGWNQITQNGAVEVVAMHDNIVAFMQDQRLMTYDLNIGIVSNSGVNFPLPTLENLDDWGKIDLWGNNIVYSTGDNTFVFDVASGATIDLTLPPLKLGGPKIYKNTIAVRGRLMEWKEPLGYYDQKETWVVTCGIPKEQ